MTNQHNHCLTYHLWLWALGFKPSERVVLWHLNLETWYRSIMTLSCDKKHLPMKTTILRMPTFCLANAPAFCFETTCGCCVTERRSLQILMLIFSSVSSLTMLPSTRSWNSNCHPYLTLSYWASVFWRVLVSILAFRLGGTSSTILAWTTSYMSLNTNKNENGVCSTSGHWFFSQLICGTKLRPYIKSVAVELSRPVSFCTLPMNLTVGAGSHITPG